MYHVNQSCDVLIVCCRQYPIFNSFNFQFSPQKKIKNQQLKIENDH